MKKYLVPFTTFALLLNASPASADQFFCKFKEKSGIERSFDLAQDLKPYDRVNAPVQTAFISIPEDRSSIVSGFVNLVGKRVLVAFNDKVRGGSMSMSGGVEESFFSQWLLPDGSYVQVDCKIIKNALM